MFAHYPELQFTHFVVTADGTIFASARHEGRAYNFLLHESYVRAQHGEQWIDLESSVADIIRDKARSVYAIAPRYKTGRLIFD
jgi:hypothetical protein